MHQRQQTRPTGPTRAALAAAFAGAALVLAPAPVLADRDTDRLIAGALVLGAVGLAIAHQNEGYTTSNRDLTGPALNIVTAPRGQITVPIHITPARPLYTGPGGVAPGTRSDPLAGLGTQTAEPAAAPVAAAIKPPGPPQNTWTAIGSGAESNGILMAPLAAAVAERTDIAPVTVSTLPPTDNFEAVPAAPGPIQPAPVAIPTGPVIPGHCLHTYDQSGENRALYGPECLAEAELTTATLPVSCAVTLRTLGRFVSGYDPACLSAAGYTLATAPSP